MLGFRGFDSSLILMLEGWNSHVHGEFPGNFESSNLSRDNLSREIGRTFIKIPERSLYPRALKIPMKIT